MSLPSGYTKLGYIESEGSQYIDTGIIPDENTKVIMDFQLTAAGTNNRCLFGVAGQFSFRWYGSGSVFRSNGGGSADFSTGMEPLERHTVEKTATQTTIDGTYSVTTTAGTVTLSLYLLAQHAASSTTNYAPAKLYSCQIYDGDTLVRDFIPCINASGTAGLWDDVNSVFYTDAGGGSFPNPRTPAGDHNTLIDGAAYAIESGKVLLGGTEYEIESGTVLMGGTAYEISFAKKVTVVLTGTIKNAYASINGTSYTATGTYEAESPATIIVYVASDPASAGDKCWVKLNGTKVQSGYGKYTFTTEASTVTIKFASTYDGDTYATAEITTS